MISKETNFLIVGLGLIGGSYARALKAVGCKVTGIDVNPDSIGYGLHEGIIDDGSIENDPKLISKADVIILGLYPKTEVQWVQENQHLFKPNTLLTDVSGVKSGIVEPIQAFLREDCELISCHPMAGREVNGVRNSKADLFTKSNFIVVTTQKNSKEAIQDAYELGALLGSAKISELTIQQHDHIIGFVSQLTHAIAVSLMTCNEDKNLQEYTGDSFRDLTRIARINENMWSELFVQNKEELVSQIDAFTNQLKVLRDLIENEDVEEMKKLFIASTERRKLFDKT